MTDENKQARRSTQRMLALLARLAATKYHKEFNVKAGSREVIALLEWANKSTEQDVHALLVECGEVMSPTHRRFFESNGISFLPLAEIMAEHKVKTYRGHTIVDEPAAQGSEKHPQGQDTNMGKKKIVYRGQVKWV